MLPATPRRPARAVLLSAALVLAPLAGTLACLALATGTLAAAVPAGEASGALLGLAALALAGVLAWATAATAAGVVEAWALDRPQPARRGGSYPVPPSGTALAQRRSRTAAVSAGVAAIVVAALTTPTASATAPAASATAATAAHERPSPVTEHTVESSADAAVTAAPPDPAPAAGAAVPGSWAALAGQGFRAPRGASAEATALVTAGPSRQDDGDRVPDVVVLAGDSLWSIAARHLGAGADATEVAAAWPRWWQANRDTVGDDPDLLLPGQRLVVPLP